MMDKGHMGVMIHDAAHRYGDCIAMGHRARRGWVTATYREMLARIRTAARALIDMGIAPGDTVAIYSLNRPEWTLIDFAALSVGAVSVPIHATSTAGQMAYILRDANVKAVFTDDRERCSRVVGIDGFQGRIVVFDADAAIDSPRICRFDDLDPSADEGVVDERLRGGRGGDLATVIYTSGTTGEPKGVMLTHHNFAHQIRAVDAAFSLGVEDRSLCFLPLSHVYERAWSYYVFYRGARNYYQSNPREVLAGLREVRPTAMVSVPRLYEKVYSAVQERLETAPPLRRRLFNWALSIGAVYEDARRRGAPAPGLRLRHAAADRLVLAKIRSLMGGKKKFLSAGGAPLAADIEAFFYAAGLLVCQGYGLTETSPMITYNTPGHFKFGTVGRPVPECEVRIAENGEILVRGAQVMKGYLNRPEDTAEALRDGWLHTGDVGQLDDEGYLRITDRIKDLIITSGGKNIAPQRIESLVGRDAYIEQVAVFGDRRKFASALIVPDFEVLEAYTRRRGLVFASRAELIAAPEIVEFYRQRIDRQSAELAAYERIGQFTLLPRSFTQEDGEITPTIKVRRKIIRERYGEIIDAMYRADGTVR